MMVAARFLQKRKGCGHLFLTHAQLHLKPACVGNVNEKAKEILYMDVIFIFYLYVIIINITGFALMGIDKFRARRKAWRIPEARLFGAALLGGSVGSIVGMYVFRHKTRHWYFVWGMPAILILQLAAAYFLFFKL